MRPLSSRRLRPHTDRVALGNDTTVLLAQSDGFYLGVMGARSEEAGMLHNQCARALIPLYAKLQLPI